MTNLSSKTLVITGGSLGIGLACAKKCAAEGATVIIAARNVKDLAGALIELRAISDKPHASYQLDISQCNKVQEFAEWCKSKYAGIDGLVNCAGVYGPIGKSTEVDMTAFTEAITINFLGTVYMCHAFAPILSSRGRRKIVNYAGGGAASPFANYSAYATSKIAIVRFTENLSIELAGEQFDVNCIAPGFVNTRLHAQTMERGPEVVGEAFFEATKNIVEHGGAPPEKAADLTAFLMSAASDGITGKFLSAPWDPWQTSEFVELLKTDKDIATLRRIDNKTFFKKS